MLSQKFPNFLFLISEPSDSQLSSINKILFLRQKDLILFIRSENPKTLVKKKRLRFLFFFYKIFLNAQMKHLMKLSSHQ